MEVLWWDVQKSMRASTVYRFSRFVSRMEVTLTWPGRSWVCLSILVEKEWKVFEQEDQVFDVEGTVEDLL